MSGPGPSLMSPARLSGAALLFIAAGVALSCGPAAAVNEAEPNDAPEGGTLLNETDTGAGTLSGGGDVDYWRLVLSSAGLLTIQVDGPPSCGVVTVTGPAGLTMPVGAEFSGTQTRIYRMVAPSAGVVAVGLCGAYGLGDYTLFWDFSTDFSSIQWGQDTEPNNANDAALAMGDGASVSGRVGTEFLDLDWWSIHPGRAGWVLLNWSLATGVELGVYEGDTPRPSQAPAGGGPLLYHVDASTTLSLRVTTTQTFADYTIFWTFITDPSRLWQGPNEVEPNGAASNATPLQSGGPYLGLAAKGMDPVDAFLFVPAAGSMVTVTVSLITDQPDDVTVTLEDGGHIFEWVVAGTDVAAKIFAANNTPIVFLVATEAPDVSYRITIEERPLQVLADGRLDLQDLANDSGFGLFLDPRQTPPPPTYAPPRCPPFCTGQTLRPQEQSYNLANGDGWMFGETMCAALDVDNRVDGVVVGAGLWLWPDDTDLQSMVVSRTETISIPAGQRACFRAMSHNESGKIGQPGHSYHVHGFVEGDAGKVIAYVDQHRQDDAAGEIALWSVTSHTSAERAREWSASDADINKAQAILQAATAHTPLNPDYGPAWAALFGVLALMAVVVAVVLKRGSKRPETPPLTGGAGSPSRPTAPAYPPQYQYQQQYPGHYGQWNPYGQRPAPPSYAPAHSPPQAPPPPAPIKQATVPVLSEAPAPTRPGQRPAAPPAQQAYGSAVPCPRCRSWIARGAPYCPRCMTALYWR